MENLVQYFLDESTLWVPSVIGVVVIFVVFFILAKIMKRIITSTAVRLKFDGNLTLLLVRTSSITLMIFGFVTALGTLGVNVFALVAGLSGFDGICTWLRSERYYFQSSLRRPHIAISPIRERKPYKDIGLRGHCNID